MVVSEANLQTQWANFIDLIETTRVYVDDSVGGSTNLLDVLEKSLEGVYTPRGLSAASANFRAAASTLISPARVAEGLESILFEYGKLISDDSTVGDGFGGGYTNIQSLFRALYDHFVNNSLTVESRAITFDTTSSDDAANVGNGVINRLTVDENGFDMEACHVEKKRWRCRSDTNTGAQTEAEVFEVIGETEGPDDINREDYGSGDAHSSLVESAHAGSGGSLLRNGSFETFTDHASTPTLDGWTVNSGGATFDAETTIVYRGYPGIGTSQSMKQTGATWEIEQLVSDMRGTQLGSNTPYFLRVMVYPVSATGNITITWGSKSQVFVVGSLNDSAWNELVIDFDADCWFKNFNQDALSIKIGMGSGTGTVYIDDAIFTPWVQVDGTFWLPCPNHASHAPWRVDDSLEFTDTGGLPETAKIQYYLFLTGLGYLPSTTGTPTFTEP